MSDDSAAEPAPKVMGLAMPNLAGSQCRPLLLKVIKRCTVIADERQLVPDWRPTWPTRSYCLARLGLHRHSFVQAKNGIIYAESPNVLLPLLCLDPA